MTDSVPGHLRKILTRLAFGVIELALAPVTLAGTVLFYGKAGALAWRTGMSYTAYEPLKNRWLYHETGARPDAAGKDVLFALPGTSRLGLRLMVGPTLLAMRVTAITPGIMRRVRADGPSSVWTFVRQRTAFFDETMAHAPDRVDQIVVLGAGWDTRAYTLCKGRDIRVFEVDRAETQSHKLAALAKAGINTSNVTFVTVDFNRESWLERLQAVGFNASRPTFVLWEGVTYYLEPDVVAAMLRAVSGLAPGSEIAFDYFSREAVEGREPLVFRAVRPLLKLTGEVWVFGISTALPAREKAAQFVEASGLVLKRYAPYGQERAGKKPFGGLVLAAVGSGGASAAHGRLNQPSFIV